MTHQTEPKNVRTINVLLSYGVHVRPDTSFSLSTSSDLSLRQLDIPKTHSFYLRKTVINSKNPNKQCVVCDSLFYRSESTNICFQMEVLTRYLVNFKYTLSPTKKSLTLNVILISETEDGEVIVTTGKLYP